VAELAFLIDADGDSGGGDYMEHFLSPFECCSVVLVMERTGIFPH